VAHAIEDPPVLRTEFRQAFERATTLHPEDVRRSALNKIGELDANVSALQGQTGRGASVTV
jgi:hypothetical protein